MSRQQIDIDLKKCKKFNVDGRTLRKLLRLLCEADKIAGDLKVIVFVGSGTIHHQDDAFKNDCDCGPGIGNENILGYAHLCNFEGGDY